MFGKYGGYLAGGTGVVGLVLGLLFGGLVFASGAGQAGPSESPSQSSSPTDESTVPANPVDQPGDDELPASATDAEMKPVNDKSFPEVRYQFQLDFFKLAIANCEKLEKVGVELTFSDGRTAILGSNKDGAIARIDFDVDGNITEQFLPPIEDICMPKYFHDEAVRSFARNQRVGAFYHLDPMGGEGNIKQFAWHQHVQSAELSTVYFTFNEGVLTNITDHDFEYYGFADVGFGLSKSRLALLQEVGF
jgi:hypothetical protein